MKEAANGSAYATARCLRSLLRGIESPLQPISSGQSKCSLLRLQGRKIRATKQMGSSSRCAFVSLRASIPTRRGSVVGETFSRYSIRTRSRHHWHYTTPRMAGKNPRFAQSPVCIRTTIRPNRICDHRNQESWKAIRRAHWPVEDGSRKLQGCRSYGRIGTRSEAHQQRRREGKKSVPGRLSLDPSLSDKKTPPPPPPPKPLPPTRKHRTGDSQPPNVIRPATPYPPPPPSPPRKDK